MPTNTLTATSFTDTHPTIGGASYTGIPAFVQTAWRIRTDATAAEGGTPVWAAAQNTAPSSFTVGGSPFRIRFAIENTQAQSAVQFYLWVSRNGDAYTKVSNQLDWAAPVDATNGASANHSAISTSLLSSSGTWQNGEYSSVGNTNFISSLPNGYYSEYEFGIETWTIGVDTGHPVVGDTFAFQIQSGSASYNSSSSGTATLTVTAVCWQLQNNSFNTSNPTLGKPALFNNPLPVAVSLVDSVPSLDAPVMGVRSKLVAASFVDSAKQIPSGHMAASVLSSSALLDNAPFIIPVAVDQIGVSQFTTGAGLTSYSYTGLTVGAAANAALFSITTCQASPSDPTSVVWGSQPCTYVGSIQVDPANTGGSGDTFNVSLYSLFNPAPGSQTLSVSFASASFVDVFGASFCNVKSFDNVTTSFAAAPNAPSFSVIVSRGDILFGVGATSNYEAVNYHPTLYNDYVEGEFNAFGTYTIIAPSNPGFSYISIGDAFTNQSGVIAVDIYRMDDNVFPVMADAFATTNLLDSAPAIDVPVFGQTAYFTTASLVDNTSIVQAPVIRQQQTLATPGVALGSPVLGSSFCSTALIGSPGLAGLPSLGSPLYVRGNQLIELCWRIRTDGNAADGGAPTWLAPLNTTAPIGLNVPFRIRFGIESTWSETLPLTQSWYLSANRNSEGWGYVPSTPGYFIETADPTNGASAYGSALTSALLSGYIGGWQNGQYAAGAGQISLTSFAANSYTEFEYGLVLSDTSYIGDIIGVSLSISGGVDVSFPPLTFTVMSGAIHPINNVLVGIPSIGSPALAEALQAADVIVSAPTIASVTLTNVILFAQSMIDAVPSLDVPSISITYNMISVVAGPSLVDFDVPALYELNELVISDLISSTCVLGSSLIDVALFVPTLLNSSASVGSSNLSDAIVVIDCVAGAPILGLPGASQSSFAAVSVTDGAPLLDTPAINQCAVLGSLDLIISAPVFDLLVMAEDCFAASLVLSSLLLDAPAILDALFASDIITAVSLDSPILDVAFSITGDFVVGMPVFGTSLIDVLLDAYLGIIAGYPVFGATQSIGEVVMAIDVQAKSWMLVFPSINVAFFPASLIDSAPSFLAPTFLLIYLNTTSDVVIGVPLLGSSALIPCNILIASNVVDSAPRFSVAPVEISITASPIVVLSARIGKPIVGVLLVAANEVSGLPLLGGATINTNDVLFGGLVSSAPLFDVPSLVEVHILPASSLLGAVRMDTPLFNQHIYLSSILFGSIFGVLRRGVFFGGGAPIFGSPVLETSDVFVAPSIVVASPVVDHPAVFSPVKMTTTNLVIGAPTVGASQPTQFNVLMAAPLMAAAPRLGSSYVFTLIYIGEIDLDAGRPLVSVGILIQNQLFTASGILDGAPEIETPENLYMVELMVAVNAADALAGTVTVGDSL